MAGIKYNHNMFTVGMISQKLQGNTESETYNNSLLDCKNFYIRQTGGVFKRPGTLFVDTIPDALRVKLFPFNFAGDDSIVLGFQAGTVYAYNTDGLVAQCIANALTTDVINDDHFTPIQNGDSVYLFTKVGIFVIKYNTSTKTLTFSAKEFTFSPVGRVNDIKTNTATYSTNTITLSGEAKFKDSDIGQRVLLIWERPVDPDDTELRYMYQTTLLYSYFTISSLNEAKTEATVTWDKNYASMGDSAKIPTEATFRFALPAFGADRGFPIAAGILGNRLFLADNDLVIYGSRVSFDDLFDFTLGSDETCGLSYRMNNDVGTISWIVGQDKLFVGTPTGIYASSGSGVYAEEIIAPGNFSLRKFSSVHSGALLPSAINAAIVFTDSLAKNVYEIAVDETVGVYKTFDLSLLSNELLNSGCISHAWSSYPVKTYWVACKDGTLASMTYEKANNVLAWSYHDLGGNNTAVESVASIQVNGYDYVFLVVRRAFNGEIIRKVEYIDKLYEPLDNKQYQQHYTDAGQVFNYSYTINNIEQYQPPQIKTFENRLLDFFVQNENSKNQYIKCLFTSTEDKIAKDIYVEKAWQADSNTYVSFSALQEKVEHLAPDGRDLTTFTQKPLDCNKFKDYENNKLKYMGVMEEHVSGVIYDDTGKKMVLLCDPASIPSSVEYIALNSTGIKDANGDPADIDTNNIRRFKILSKDVSQYTQQPGILISMPAGYDGTSFSTDGLCEIYAIVPFGVVPTFNAGTNAVVTQSVDTASAVALKEIMSGEPGKQYPEICQGIIWDSTNNYYVVSKNNTVYTVSSDWDTWSSDGATFSQGVKKLYYTENKGYTVITSMQRYCTNDATAHLWDLGGDVEIETDVFGVAEDSSYGVAISHDGKKLYEFLGTWSEWNSTDEADLPEYNVGAGAVKGLLVNDSTSFTSAKILLAKTDSENIYMSVVNFDTLNEETPYEIEGETRKINAIVPIGERVSNAYASAYLVGEGGLLYKLDLHDLTEITWTDVATGHVCNWEGGVSYMNGTTAITFLYSKAGELLKIVEPSGQDPESYYQRINTTSPIINIFYQNDRLFLALADGGILRSVTGISYTQSCFDTQFVYIDDVYGMEGINGKKYQIANADTTELNTGKIKYELWDNGYPVDTRPLGVYDTTVSNNGKTYVYFNTLVGLGHLAGEDVTICLDGNFLEDTTVSDSGAIRFADGVYGMEAHVGYKFSAVLELMPLSGGNVRGSSVGSVGSQKSAFARLYYALGGKYGTEKDRMYPIGYPTALFKSSYDRVFELFTGIIELPLMNPRDYRERKFRMEQSEPVCFNVLSVAQDAEISDA